jgi:hypothetical protein
MCAALLCRCGLRPKRYTYKIEELAVLSGSPVTGQGSAGLSAQSRVQRSTLNAQLYVQWQLAKPLEGHFYLPLVHHHNLIPAPTPPAARPWPQPGPAQFSQRLQFPDFLLIDWFPSTLHVHLLEQRQQQQQRKRDVGDRYSERARVAAIPH